MAKLSITIDTDLLGPQYSPGGPTVFDSTNQVGLLSSITLTPEMMASFNVGLMGAPQTTPHDKTGYNPQNIKDGKDQLRPNCKVIATVGGSVVLNVLQAESKPKMPPFVSLVGSVPPGLVGNCKGGISLESITLNSMRKAYLKGLAGGNTYTDNTIYLYTNPNSAMHADEIAAWGNNNTVISSNVAQANGANNAGNFGQDFNGGGVGTNTPIPQNANAIIISDDPFFQDNQATLVPLINTWLKASGARQIVYPNQNYPSALPPTGQGAIIGPNLLQAYMLLGALAGSLLRNPNTTSPFGFVRLGSETTPL